MNMSKLWVRKKVKFKVIELVHCPSTWYVTIAMMSRIGLKPMILTCINYVHTTITQSLLNY